MHLSVLGLLIWVAPVLAQEGNGLALKDIHTVLAQGPGTPEGRAAWERLAAAEPAAVVTMLSAMKSAAVAQANWLRTAIDRIVDRERKTGGKNLPLEALVTGVAKSDWGGRARRLALEIVDEFAPGTSARLLPGWLEDSEFRYEAVAHTLTEAKQALKAGDVARATASYRTAFDSARDLHQARDAAAALEQLKINVSVADHLGFLKDWRLLGPFDGGGQKGVRLSYPPEDKIDLSGEWTGQAGKKLRWVRYRAQEPPHTSNARHQVLINLREKDALGDADDAVAFAYTAFAVEKACEAEFRGAADDNFTVWVNGKKEFSFEEWRNGVRLDRHRFKVHLRPGVNTVLVKVCQSAAPNPEPNWEFLLRVVDATGKGIPMKSVLP